MQFEWIIRVALLRRRAATLLREVARDLVAGLDGTKPRNLPITKSFLGDGTARMKRTAARWIEGARHVALQQEPMLTRGRVGLGRRAEESLRVGMTRTRVNLF